MVNAGAERTPRKPTHEMAPRVTAIMESATQARTMSTDLLANVSCVLYFLRKKVTHPLFKKKKNLNQYIYIYYF